MPLISHFSGIKPHCPTPPLLQVVGPIPNSTTPLTSKEKTRASLSLLKFEQNPDKILEICRAASFIPDSHLDRIAFSVTVSKLSSANHFDVIRQVLEEELKSCPDLKTDSFASHAIVLYDQAKMLHQAVETFQQMDRLGIDCSVKSLNALLFACLLSKDYKEQRAKIDLPRVRFIPYSRICK